MGFQDRNYYREDGGGIPPVMFTFPKLTPLTIALIAACLVIYIVQSFTRGGINDWWPLTMYHGKAFYQPWRWITYQYMHGGAGHFFFNMLALYFFLPSLELMWGWRKAFAFYTAGGVFAGITYALLVAVVPGSSISSLVGASGSIFATMGAVALLQPNRQIILVLFCVPIRIAVALLGSFFLLATITDRDFSSAAHLGGLAFGFFSPYLMGPLYQRFAKRWHKRRLRAAMEHEQAEQHEIDRILAKVSSHGMHSLNWFEKRTLKKATAHQRQRDQELLRSRGR